MAKSQSVLIVFRDLNRIDSCKKLLESNHWNVRLAQDSSQALGVLKTEKMDAVVIELDPSQKIGLDLMSAIRSSRITKHLAVTVIQQGSLADTVMEQIKQKFGLRKILKSDFTPQQLYSALTEDPEKDIQAVKSPVSYDVKIINCFLDGLSQVLEFYFTKKPTLQKPSVKTEKKASGFVTGLIGFSGKKIVGSMSITSEIDFLELLAQKVFAGDHPPLNDELMADLMGEMCNQVCGKVKMNFAKLGVELSIGLPKVVLGKDHVVFHKASTPVLMIPIVIQDKSCFMEFCLSDIVGDVGVDPASSKPIEQQEQNVIWED